MISSCSNFYNKRSGGYGPVSVHVNEERVNLFSDEGIIIYTISSTYDVELSCMLIELNLCVDDDNKDEQPLYHDGHHDDDDDDDDDAPLDLSKPLN